MTYQQLADRFETDLQRLHRRRGHHTALQQCKPCRHDLALHVLVVEKVAKGDDPLAADLAEGTKR